jgi:hypothetical protein
MSCVAVEEDIFFLKTWIKRLQLLDAYSLKTVFNLRQQTTYFEADPLKEA